MQSAEKFTGICIHSEMCLQRKRIRQQQSLKSKFEILFNQEFYIFTLGILFNMHY